MSNSKGLQLVEPDQFIYVDSWEKLSKESGHHFCSPFDLDLLLRQADGPEVVISGCGDAVLCEQAEYFPAKDLTKYLNAIDWGGIYRTKGTYPSLRIGPAVQEGRCFPEDRYSLKTDRFTWGTFHEFPKWLKKLYLVHANVQHKKVETIPFGLNDDGPGSSFIHSLQKTPKTNLLYCNLQWNSERRYAVKDWYSRQRWATYRHEPNIPVQDYLKEVASHQFNLCPVGNGFDQYRLYETIYLGSIPVLEDSTWARSMQKMGIPVLVVSDVNQITPDFLNRYWSAAQEHVWDYSKLTMDHWRSELSKANLST